MLSTRYSKPILSFLIVMFGLIFLLGVVSAHAEAPSENANDEDWRMERYMALNDEYSERKASYLVMYGLTLDDYQQLIGGIAEIDEDFRVRYYDEVYGMDYYQALATAIIKEEYPHGGRLLAGTGALQTAWENYLRNLREELDAGEWTATAMTLSVDFEHAKYEDGSNLADYLPPLRPDADACGAWLSALERFSVDEDGYLVNHFSDGTQKRLLAGYGVYLWSYDPRDTHPGFEFNLWLLKGLPYGEEIFDLSELDEHP